MDAPTIVAIIGIAIPVVTTLGGYLWSLHQSRIKKLEDKADAQSLALTAANLEHEKARAEMQRETSEAIAQVERKQAAFELEAARTFITQPALLQVMTTLDRTLASMGELMKENQRETRAGLDALNKRIDSIFTDHRTTP
jgi:molecular chaperone GrpE (heat shock protein)